MRNVSAAGLALLVTKGINQFPEPDVKLRGTIDVWWIVHILFLYSHWEGWNGWVVRVCLYVCTYVCVHMIITDRE